MEFLEEDSSQEGTSIGVYFFSISHVDVSRYWFIFYTPCSENESIVSNFKRLDFHSSLSGLGSSTMSFGFSALIELSFSGFKVSTTDYHLLTRI